MKTNFLKELGIVEQSVIDAIMAENGRDIEKVKGDNEATKTEIEGLKAQIAERDAQLKELKKSVGDNEALTAKIAELEETNKKTKSEYEEQLETLRKDSEIELKLRDAKAKNVKAVRALLNADDDLDKQIKTLKENEETSFLFDSEKQEIIPPKGSTPAGGQSSIVKPEPSFIDAIRKGLNMN